MGLQRLPDSLTAPSHPRTSFQTVGIAEQNCVPMTQGFFRFLKFFQQRGERTSGKGIRRTVRQPRLQQGDPLHR